MTKCYICGSEDSFDGWVTAGRDPETDEPRDACNLCWDARHPPPIIKDFRHLMMSGERGWVHQRLAKFMPYSDQKKMIEDYNAWEAETYVNRMRILVKRRDVKPPLHKAEEVAEITDCSVKWKSEDWMRDWTVRAGAQPLYCPGPMGTSIEGFSAAEVAVTYRGGLGIPEFQVSNDGATWVSVGNPPRIVLLPKYGAVGWIFRCTALFMKLARVVIKSNPSLDSTVSVYTFFADNERTLNDQRPIREGW